MRVPFAIGLLALTTTLVGVLQAGEFKKPKTEKITVFVGPREREGFVDVDSGVLESIKDIQEQIRRSSKFVLAPSLRDAKIALIVLSRRTPGDSAGIGIPMGAGMTMNVPIKQRAIDLILRVGTYEKAIASETPDGDDRWSSAAKTVVKDLTAWTDANRSALTAPK